MPSVVDSCGILIGERYKTAPIIRSAIENLNATNYKMAVEGVVQFNKGRFSDCGGYFVNLSTVFVNTFKVIQA